MLNSMPSSNPMNFFKKVHPKNLEAKKTLMISCKNGKTPFFLHLFVHCNFLLNFFCAFLNAFGLSMKLCVFFYLPTEFKKILFPFLWALKIKKCTKKKAQKKGKPFYKDVSELNFAPIYIGRNYQVVKISAYYYTVYAVPVYILWTRRKWMSRLRLSWLCSTSLTCQTGNKLIAIKVLHNVSQTDFVLKHFWTFNRSYWNIKWQLHGKYAQNNVINNIIQCLHVCFINPVKLFKCLQVVTLASVHSGDS
jgi:hypothetical protein